MRRGLRRALRRLGNERGQMMVLYVFALPAALATCALALDGGKFFVTRIHLQNAADASALGSAQDLGQFLAGLGGNPDPQIRKDVNCYASMNRAPVGGCAPPNNNQIQQCHNNWWSMTSAQRAADMDCYSWPYVDKNGVSHDDMVEVRLRQTVNLSFGGLPGIPKQAHPWARAVATYKAAMNGGSVLTVPTSSTSIDPDQTSTTVVTSTVVQGGSTIVSTETLPDSISTNVSTIPGSVHTVTNITPGNSGGGVAWAASTDCAAISWTGSQTGSLGDFGTNGGFFSNGATPKTMHYLAVGLGPSGPCFKNSAPVTIGKIIGPFSPQPFPLTPPTPPTPIPLGQARGANQCWDLGSGAVTFQVSPSHPSGVYCVTGNTGSLTVTSDLTVGGHTYTFFAPTIVISGGKVTNYPPVAGAPPTLLYASQDITVQGSGSVLTGDIFAPNGAVSIRGSGVSGGSGFIECQTLSIAGNFASYTGTGPFGGGGTEVVTVTDPDTTTTTVTTTPGATTTHTTVSGGTTYQTVTTSTTVIAGQTHTITTSTTITTPGSTATTGTLGLGE